jgi:hypothetical protein
MEVIGDQCLYFALDLWLGSSKAAYLLDDNVIQIYYLFITAPIYIHVLGFL